MLLDGGGGGGGSGERRQRPAGSSTRSTCEEKHHKNRLHTVCGGGREAGPVRVEFVPCPPAVVRWGGWWPRRWTGTRQDAILSTEIQFVVI